MASQPDPYQAGRRFMVTVPTDGRAPHLSGWRRLAGIAQAQASIRVPLAAGDVLVCAGRAPNAFGIVEVFFHDPRTGEAARDPWLSPFFTFVPAETTGPRDPAPGYLCPLD